MEFQGGEPFLAFDKIQFAVRRAVELNILFKKQVTFVVCTNVTVLTDEMLEFCQQFGIHISTSLDGPEFLHNLNRPKSGAKSFQLVIDGIDKCRKFLGHDKVGALMTTTNLSLKHPIEIIETYREYGFANIFLRPISPYGFAMKNPKTNKYQTDSYLDFYKKGLLYILSLNKQGYFFVEDYAAIILKKILSPFGGTYVDLQSPSGVVSSVVVFNYDGYVYASDEARMLAEQKDFTFQLGRITDTYESIFYGSRARDILQHGCNESLAGCSDCGFQAYCGADPVFHHASQGDMDGYRPTSAFCVKNMEIIRFIFQLIDEEPDVLRVFQSWIKKRSI
jgi:His-Xaa-Ser system radical SAM maturase HxsB